MRFVGKIAMLIFNDTEEKAVEKAIAALADMIPLEAIQPPHSPALIFPGLEIRLHQRRVLKDGIDVSLTRLEYGALCCLAANQKLLEPVCEPVGEKVHKPPPHLHKDRFRHRLQVCFRGITTG